MARKSPDRIALDALDEALAKVVEAAKLDGSAAVTRRIRAGLEAHALATEAARADTDPIGTPRAMFDPSDPKTAGRMVAIALLAQPRIELGRVEPAYGSGVYAIYYEGDHPLYRAISGTETPIYVGKADPSARDASTPREQGPRLTGRLLEHAGTISTAEQYALANPETVADPIRLSDFTCRRLVCATNAQLVAEKHLIGMFWPLWNSDTKACWGMSKHGDAATTRRNKRSPWDVVHQGRLWALSEELEDSLSVEEIERRISDVLTRVPPRSDHSALVEEMIAAFRQQDGDLDVPEESPLGDVEGPSDEEADD
jgi:hypothetical protein